MRARADGRRAFADSLDQFAHMPDALRDDDPEGKMRPERVRQHRLLPDQQRPRAMKQEHSLVGLARMSHRSAHQPATHVLDPGTEARERSRLEIDVTELDQASLGRTDEPAVLPLDASVTDGTLGIVPDSKVRTHF